MRFWNLFILFCAATAPALAFGEEAGERRFLPIDQAGEWSGVGRLNARGGFCTAALIGPDTLLTAAHCIFDRATGRPIPASEMRFVAGMREGYHTAWRRVVSARAHPDWSGFFGEGVQVAGDIAVVRLESPITNIEGRSYAIGPAPREGDDVVLLSFGRDREDALSIQEPCQVLERFEKSAALNCDVTYGASGAPVFNDGRIVGVISAMSRDEGAGKVAFAVMVDGALAAMAAKPAPAAAQAAPASPSVGAARSLFRSAPGGGGGGLPGGKRPPG